MKANGRILIVAIVVLSLLSACTSPLAPSPTAEPTPTASPTETPTPTAIPTETPVPTATPDPCNTREADEWLFETDAVMMGTLEIMVEAGLNLNDLQGSDEQFRKGAMSQELQQRAILVFEGAIDKVEETQPPACLEKAGEYVIQGLEGYLEFWEDLAAGGNFDSASLNLGSAAGKFFLFNEEISTFCNLKEDSVYCRLIAELQQLNA